MKFLLASFLLIILTVNISYPQSSGKEEYFQAEEFMFNKNYQKALSIYQVFLGKEPENANLNFKVGFCLLNIAAKKEQSVSYLEKAAKNVSKKYKPYSYEETYAPLEALFYLGKAYHVNYKFQQAIETYNKLVNLLTSKDDEFITEIKHEIEMCKNGIELIAHPVNIIETNLGKGFNTEFSEHSPTFSADESVFIFTSRRQGVGGLLAEDGQYYEDIYISHNINGIWSRPINIGKNINSPEHEASVGLSADGKLLLIYNSNEGDGNIYISRFENNEWSIPDMLEEPINTKYQETSATLSADGKTIYFTSDRKGGFGGKDIYMSKLLDDDIWGEAVNLGPNINTPYDEEGPYIHADGVTLFFSSKGHKSMGGFDIFYSVMDKKGNWCDAINIGYPINSPADDIFFAPTADGKRGYYASYKDGGNGETDLYLVNFVTKKEKPISLVSGIVTSDDGTIPQDVVITVKEAKSQKAINICTINSETGKYLFILEPGNEYYISYESEKYVFHSEQITIPEESSYQEIQKAIILEPIILGKTSKKLETGFEEDKYAINNSTELLLKDVSETLNKNKELVVEVPVDESSDLSKARYYTIRKNLTQKNIAENRIKSKNTSNENTSNSVLLNIMDTSYLSMKEDEYNISFESNKFNDTLISYPSRIELTKLSRFLNDNVELGVEVLVINADDLSEKRSEFIINVLNEEGISENRITTKNITDENASNNVVELKVVEKKPVEESEIAIVAQPTKEEEIINKETETKVTAPEEKNETKVIIAEEQPIQKAETKITTTEEKAEISMVTEKKDTKEEIETKVIINEEKPVENTETDVTTPEEKTEISMVTEKKDTKEETETKVTTTEEKPVENTETNVTTPEEKIKTTKESKVSVTTNNKPEVSTIATTASSQNKIVLQSIFFEYGQSTTTKYYDYLKKLASYLTINPKLKIEIRGYADALGSDAFNKKLTEKRATFVKDYLVSNGVNPNSLVLKAFGEADPIALNANPNGEDNPEGRKYNRRVDIKMLAPVSNIITEDVTIPKYMDLRYTILIIKQKEKLPRDYFYEHDTLKNVTPQMTPDGYAYTIGNFTQKTDADNFLKIVKNEGFIQARVIHKYELENPKENAQEEPIATKKEDKFASEYTYTIQLKALKNPVELSYFQDLKGITRTLGQDNLYRYYYGVFETYEKASEKLEQIISMGYPGSFIKKLDTVKVALTDKKHEKIKQDNIIDNDVYTIQIKVLSKPADADTFKDLKGVKEYPSSDGFYKYTYGEFVGYLKAKEELTKIQEMGYNDAFIININKLKK